MVDMVPPSSLLRLVGLVVPSFEYRMPVYEIFLFKLSWFEHNSFEVCKQAFSMKGTPRQALLVAFSERNPHVAKLTKSLISLIERLEYGWVNKHTIVMIIGISSRVLTFSYSQCFANIHTAFSIDHLTTLLFAVMLKSRSASLGF